MLVQITAQFHGACKQIPYLIKGNGDCPGINDEYENAAARAFELSDDESDLVEILSVEEIHANA